MNWRKRADNVKQGSEGVHDRSWLMHDYVTDGAEEALELYERLLDSGVAPEQARMVLPQNTMTNWIWSGSLGAFCDMLILRLDPHAQYESRIVAEQIRDIAITLFPISVEARLQHA